MRFFDVLFSLIGIIGGLPIFFMIFLIGLIDTGSPIFLQKRVGRHKRPFTLVKFRTMELGTASVGTHLANASSVTRVGGFLRRSKLDELPQLVNVFLGSMSLVGPRPCLLNQEELIRERDTRGVFEFRPGITGLAQIKDIDMSTPKLLAETDERMLETLSLKSYFRYILVTLLGKGFGDRVQ